MDVMGERRVAVTGMGLVTPLGCDQRTVWSRIARGESGAAFLPERLTELSGARYYCPVREAAFPAGVSRHLDFAVAAARSAVRDARLERGPLYGGIGVSVGSSKGGLAALESCCHLFIGNGMGEVDPGAFKTFFASSAALAIAQQFGFGGPVSEPGAACATGAHAILIGRRMIASGAADVVVAGATESCLTPLVLAGYRRMGVLAGDGDSPASACRPFDRSRSGFIPGEGCGIVVLEEMEHARARGARVRAELKGGAMGEDTYHMTAPDPSGAALGVTLEDALRDSGVAAGEIDYINAHGTGTRLNDPAETESVKKAFGKAAYGMSLSSTKPLTGHLLGAAATVEFIIVVMALEGGIVPPTINLRNPDERCDLDYTPLVARRRDIGNALSISCGFGGHIGVLVAGKP